MTAGCGFNYGFGFVRGQQRGRSNESEVEKATGNRATLIRTAGRLVCERGLGVPGLLKFVRALD